ncbi:MAG TPA: hypothetical protein VGM90_20550 [Kofleriaceae bacterium]
MNAVVYMARLLTPEAARRLAALRVQRFDRVASKPAANADAHARVAARWHHDLCGLLNAMTRDELEALAMAMRLSVASDAKVYELRMALWIRGAELERSGVEIARALQPRPTVLSGHLVVQAPPRGLAPPCAIYPRPLPEQVHAMPPSEEPDSIDELLAAATRAIGVRLGPRGRDKGAWGMRAAELLGVIERGHDEPDWRGDVEVKTVPIERDETGKWAIVEDPAIAMAGEGSAAYAKLQRTLWLARATLPTGKAADATIVSWYLLDWDAEVARLAKRYLHERPKGPKQTKQKGLYLAKRFFADAGLLATLNGVEA